MGESGGGGFEGGTERATLGLTYHDTLTRGSRDSSLTCVHRLSLRPVPMGVRRQSPSHHLRCCPHSELDAPGRKWWESD